MSIKQSFSIKDLENLSGVKAHTIRIWEKRYNLLTPERTQTNIRTYNIESLQKLLNVASLNEAGIKVSKIAQFTEDELLRKVKEISVVKTNAAYSVELNSFKLAMINFDSYLFNKTYNSLLTRSSFREIFLEVFIPLLEEIGNLWTTKTLQPAHERFISTLIKQKLLLNIERVQVSGNIAPSEAFVLFLPEGELHDIGLLYIQFELLLNGVHSIFLGESVPMDNLMFIQRKYDKLTFVSYFTVQPEKEEISSYLMRFNEEILSVRNEKLFVLGKQVQGLDAHIISKNISFSNNIIQFLDQVTS